VVIVTKQWLQISAIWFGVAVFASYAVLSLEPASAFGSFSALAGASIALVSLEHLFSARAKDTVRQQVYVAAGSATILGIATVAILLL
jgi:hypothetical protein